MGVGGGGGGRERQRQVETHGEPERSGRGERSAKERREGWREDGGKRKGRWEWRREKGEGEKEREHEEMTVSVSQGYSGSCPSSWSLPRRQPQVSRSCNVPSPGPGNHWLTSDSQVLPLTPSLSPPTSCFCGPACFPASGPGLDVSLDCASSD